MSNWRELGVIPDSEDEGEYSGDDESLFLPDTQKLVKDPLPESQYAENIWDFPESDDDCQSHISISKVSLSSSRPILRKQPELTAIPSALAEGTTQNHIQPSSLNNTQPNSTLVPTFDKVASLSNRDIVDASGPTFGDINAIRSNSITAFALSLSTPHNCTVTARGNEFDQHVTDWEAIEVASSHRRSLRPRKPIQEHPYLIENAQYSSVLRQHGVRPVKMPINIERHQPAGALPDDCLDQYSQNGILPPGTDRMDGGSFAVTLGEHDRLDISPASLNRPLSYNQSASNSSTGSPADGVGDSGLDQDLPDLDQLLNRYTRTSERNATIQVSQIQPLTQKIRRRDIILSHSPPEPNAAITRISTSPNTFAESLDLDTQQIVHINPRKTTDWKTTDRKDYSTETLPKPLTSASASASAIEVPSQEFDNQDGNGLQEYRRGSETSNQFGSDTHQMVTEFRRHIRGVLPASWLRLDQELSKTNSRRSPSRRLQYRLPNGRKQRGLALTKTTVPDSTTFNLFPLELDEESPTDYTSDNISEHQAEISSSPSPDQEIDCVEESPVVEETSMDPIVVGSKRQLQLPKTSRGHRKRNKVSSGSRPQFAQTRSRQQAINGYLHSRPDELTHSLTIDHFSDNSLQRLNNEHGNSINKPMTSLKPLPLLSILDIIDPDAPRFIRIAARSAKKTLSQGRSSVRQKIIKLATRQDQVDAMSVLEKWKSGLIKQRASISTASKSKPKHRHKHTHQKYSDSEYTSKSVFGTSRGSSRKLIKYLGERGLVRYRRNGSAIGEMNILPPPISKRALLEIDEGAKRAISSFHSRKGALDHIFSKQKQNLPAWRLADNINPVARGSGFTKPYIVEHTPPRMSKESEQRQSRILRFRKSNKPCKIDVKAPQYIHVEDPLPVYSPIIVTDSPPQKSKLYGLGPFGTRYTHHFDIFPLMPEVRFHESTLLGSGNLQTFWVEDSHLREFSYETQISIRLGDQVFKWGSWNQQVSSEIGILFDIIAERLEGNPQRSLHDRHCAITAVHSILEYVKDTLDSAKIETPTPPLISRLQAVFHSFIGRIGTGLSQSLFDHVSSRHLVLKILDRVLLMSSLMIKHCQSTPQLMDQHPEVGNLLLSLAQLIISVLFHCGLDQVKKIYQDFSQFNCHDRTLRESAVAVHSWTLLIKTFEHAGPQQVSFWDVLETILLRPHILSGTNAVELERVWETMFTLLPLFEFDDTGKIATEKRLNAGTGVWGMPQKLIRRVFQLYQENNQQTPSFNDYCRALISRCYYLVQQWNWCHSASIVGVIFDFFGSQRLAHLRNEEVYQSPRFLEDLANESMLEIEADDYCFHIFLKFLAISIKKLRRFGSEKDIRNLVTRTIPNHNRLYHKELNVHERDLAALRNHHDLIGTLFWATPPGVRPPVTLIEGLIAPASSHKEACLINIRAWAQLARFIVSSGEARTSFKPLNIWRDSFFKQVTMQFDGIAADIHQQYLTLSKDTSKCVTQDIVDTMISKNKAAVMDILHLSFTASVDVMRHASDLEAATYCLSTPHLERIFRYFAVSPSELDWSILRTALAILDIFLSKIEEFKDNQESQQSESQMLDSAQADDALLILKQDISCSYFSMARCILSSPIEMPSLSAAGMADKTWCIRQVVTLSARMGVGFNNCGLLKISDMLKPGKYCLFNDKPYVLDPSHRQYFMLFISTLLKHGFDDFSDAGFTICEIWALALVTPLKYMKFENLIDIQRHCSAKSFVPDDIVKATTQPNYKTNQRLFEFEVSSMRKYIRTAEPGLRRVLDLEYSKTLKLVMKQMRNDLGLMYMDTSQHRSYVVFVQNIISSIKAHGSVMCTVDNFFLQISRQYSPPIQDPQLQIAGMLSYGIRIEEGDPRAAHQLFFLLFNNFKYALANGSLTDDAHMLWNGMKHKSILAFVLGKMLPAIICVSFTDSSSFPLLDVYIEALRLFLNGRILPRQLDNDDLPHVSITLRAIVEGMRRMRLSDEILSGPRIHILRQALAILNLLWPSLLIANTERPENSRLVDIRITIRHIASFATAAERYLRDLAKMGNNTMDIDLLFEGLQIRQPLSFNTHVDGFAASIRDDIAKNWMFSSQRISLHIPIRTGQEKYGIANPKWIAGDIVHDLYERIQEWYWWWTKF
ncbi:Mus7/MMS22 family domain-containing protein [Trichoderma ceciliae]